MGRKQWPIAFGGSSNDFRLSKMEIALRYFASGAGTAQLGVGAWPVKL
jgi:hypothetical protein